MNVMAGLLQSVRWSGAIEDADVLAARRAVYGDDGAIAQAELDALFAIDEAAKTACDSWVSFFAEAVSDHLVHQVQPHGYIDAANAAWLIARIDKDGLVKSASELEALIKCLEAATSAPETLSAYALKQVASAVIDGEGPLSGGRHLAKGRIDAVDVTLLRRILYAFGGSGNAAITRSEADVLFDLNDRTAGLDNDPAWSDLFIKAVANFMMAASGYHAPSREVALRREQWLDQPTGGVIGFFSRMFSGDLDWLKKEYSKSATETANEQRAAEIAGNAIVTDGEAEWLADRIGRDGMISANERALLTFIKDDAGSLHPKLQPLLNRAA
jgi:hypothetical protein